VAGHGGTVAWELVTEIIDRCQSAVMSVGVAGPASPGQRTPSCGGGPGVPRRRKASHGDRRQRADALSRVSLPNTEFRSGTIAPASPRDAERNHLLRTLQATQWVLGGAAGAAAYLGLTHTTLQALVKRCGLVRPRTRRHLGTCRNVGSRASALAPPQPQLGRGVTCLLSATYRRVPGRERVWHRACSDSLAKARRTAAHAERPRLGGRPASSPDRRCPARLAATPEGEQPRPNGVTALVPGPSEQ
jgi:hypothetical protein